MDLVIKLGKFKSTEGEEGNAVEIGKFVGWMEHFSRQSRVHEALNIHIKQPPPLGSRGFSANTPSIRAVLTIPRAPRNVPNFEADQDFPGSRYNHFSQTSYNVSGTTGYWPNNNAQFQHHKDASTGSQQRRAPNDEMIRPGSSAFRPRDQTHSIIRENESFVRRNDYVIRENERNHHMMNHQRFPMEDLPKMLETKDKRIKELEEDLEGHKNSVDRKQILDTVMKNLEARNLDLRRALEKVASQHTKLDTVNETLKNTEGKLQRAEAEISRLSSTTREHDVDELNRKLDECEKQLRVKESQLSKIHSETDENRRLEDRLRRTNKETDRLKQTIHDYEEQTKHFSKKCETLEQDLKRMTANFETRTKACNESSEIILREKRIAKDAEALAIQLRDELKRAKFQISTKDKVIQAANAEIQTQKRQLSEDLGGGSKPQEIISSRNKSVSSQVRELSEQLRLKDEDLKVAHQRASTLEILRDGDAAEVTMLKAKIEELKSAESKSKKEAKKYKSDLIAKQKQLNHALSLVASFGTDETVYGENKHDRSEGSDEDSEQTPKRIKQEGQSNLVTLD
jgi:chromosome segregation ATPase